MLGAMRRKREKLNGEREPGGWCTVWMGVQNNRPARNEVRKFLRAGKAPGKNRRKKKIREKRERGNRWERERGRQWAPPRFRTPLDYDSNSPTRRPGALRDFRVELVSFASIHSLPLSLSPLLRLSPSLSSSCLDIPYRMQLFHRLVRVLYIFLPYREVC